MTKYFKILCLLVLLLTSSALFAQEPPKRPEDLLEDASAITNRIPLQKVVGKVVSVHDGDTVQVLDENKTLYKIRFNGIDAPETKQDFGSKSKQSLSDLVFGKIVTIEYDKIDR